MRKRPARKDTSVVPVASSFPAPLPPPVFSWSALLPVPGYPGWYIGPYFPTCPPGVMQFLVVAENVIALSRGGFSSLSAIPPPLLIPGQKRNHHLKRWESDPRVYEYVTEPELSSRRREAKLYIGDMVEALGKYLSIERVVSGPWRGGIEKSLPRGDQNLS